MLYENLKDKQKEIFDDIVKGQNIFLTGNAGTGKSYLIKAYDEYCKKNKINLVKVAPTGIAAVEIDGATIHSQFRLKTELDLGAPNWNNKNYKFLLSTDVLLIDEISMVRIDIFDKLMQIIEMANKRRGKRKPIQLIVTGDFFQLPPVINSKNGEKEILNKYYDFKIGDGYCFKSKYWDNFHFVLRTLTDVIRQDDEEFCNELDKCKMGDSSCTSYFNSHTSKEIIEDAIWLCGKNATANAKNELELEKINKPTLYEFARYTGDVTENDNLCEAVFKYKIGARVLITTNDFLGMYHNGSTGTIIDKGKDCIYIELDDLNVVRIEPMEYTKIQYETKEIITEQEVIDEDGNSKKIKTKELVLGKKITGKAIQYPLKLGYATTIHKSQGQTYDGMNLVPEIFSNGQLYVALSRCKSVENIYLKDSIKPYMVKTSEDVINFYNNIKNDSEKFVNITIKKDYLEKVMDFIKTLETKENTQI